MRATIQFTKEEIQQIRARARQFPQTIATLKKSVAEVFEGEIIVPTTGIANWTLYFYCPDCSVPLTFNRNSPHQHVCPSCHKTWTGEPFDSAWWGKINSQNESALYAMATLWLITEDSRYAQKAANILLAYAHNYPNYEVHGDIPYNGPGRSGAQTLDEANFQKALALTYDILADYLTAAQKNKLRDQLFLPGAEFLMPHRHNQLHNHEVVIDSAIAIIGMIFGVEKYIQFGLYEKFGLYDELDRGLLPNEMWFEGTFGYHLYALQAFMAFEKFALHTEHSHIHADNYRKMFERLYAFIQPDGNYPMLNDTNRHHFSHALELYEFGYREIGGEKLAYVLNRYYEQHERDNLESLLYGVAKIPTTQLQPGNYHSALGTSGYTILRGAHEKYFLLKHDSYGGEHDHYDRLSLNYLAYGQPISLDLGTTGYGARLHYDYYKNTGTHNTVTIGGQNQAPVNAKLTHYAENKSTGEIRVEACADWTAPYEKLDMVTIKQWSDENYRPVKMKRTIIWAADYFVEVFVVSGVAEGLAVDWGMHFNGEQLNLANTVEISASEYPFKNKPETYFEHVRTPQNKNQPVHQSEYKIGEVHTKVFALNNGQTTYYCDGPDNPSTRTILFLIERTTGRQAVFAHVFDSWVEQPHVKGVEFRQSQVGIEIVVSTRNNHTQNYRVDFNS